MGVFVLKIFGLAFKILNYLFMTCCLCFFLTFGLLVGPQSPLKNVSRYGKGRLLFYMKLAIFGLALACRRGYCRGGSCVFLANWYACCQHHHDRICMVRRDHNGVKIFMKSNHILYATIIQRHICAVASVLDISKAPKLKIVKMIYEIFHYLFLLVKDSKICTNISSN